MSRGIVALCLVVISACAPKLEAAGDLPPATDRCQAAELQQVTDGGHLVDGEEPPVPYTSTPPTSGWHASGAVPAAVKPPADPLTEPEQVTILELGGIVATYRDIDGDELRSLMQLAGTELAGTVAVTSYDKIEPGQVVFASWGVLQRCEGVDLAALRTFVDAYVDETTASETPH